MLHIIQTSPYHTLGFANCMQHAQADDAIILIEDGVLAAMKNTKYGRTISKQEDTLQLYALANDVEARGIEAQLISLIQLIDYEQFVELTVQHHPIMTWK